METHSTSSVLDRVREIIAAEMNVRIEDVKPESRLSSFVADSLELLGLLVEFETQFDVNIERDDYPNILTVADAARFIEEHKR